MRVEDDGGSWRPIAFGSYEIQRRVQALRVVPVHEATHPSLTRGRLNEATTEALQRREHRGTLHRARCSLRSRRYIVDSEATYTPSSALGHDLAWRTVSKALAVSTSSTLRSTRGLVVGLRLHGGVLVPPQGFRSPAAGSGDAATTLRLGVAGVRLPRTPHRTRPNFGPSYAGSTTGWCHATELAAALGSLRGLDVGDTRNRSPRARFAHASADNEAGSERESSDEPHGG